MLLDFYDIQDHLLILNFGFCCKHFSRIMMVESADEFYSIMGVLTREMLEFGTIDANNLIKVGF
jgi:hypothetical protein